MMHQFAATILESSSKALAAYAASDLQETHPQASERFAPHAHRAWQEFFEARLEELSAALLVNDPRLFASDIAWAKGLFSVRDVPLNDLRVAMGVLRVTIERELPEKVQSCIPPFFDQAEEELASDAVRLPEGISTDTPHGRLGALFLQAVLEGERWRASRLILDAVEDGLPVSDAYQLILVPIAREVGRMWHTGELNIAEEHFATATIEMVMSLLHQHMKRRPRNGKTVIVTAAQGNYHSLAVRLIGDFYEMDGWRVIHLGGDMPAKDLARAVVDFDADLVAISVTMTRNLHATKACIDTLRNTEKGEHVKILLGGLAFDASDNAWKKLGADGCAYSADEAVEIGAKLVGLPPRSDRATAG